MFEKLSQTSTMHNTYFILRVRACPQIAGMNLGTRSSDMESYEKEFIDNRNYSEQDCGELHSPHENIAVSGKIHHRR